MPSPLMRKWLLPASSLLATLLVAAAAPAWAFPVGHPDDAPESMRLAPTVEELTAPAVDFTAIVALSNCSGALVRFTTSRADDKAMVLSNGHCRTGFVTAGDAVVGEPSSRTFSLLSSNGKTKIATLRASELMYATMTGTDITLYRLTLTNAQITARYGVTPLTIADHHPDAAAPVRIVSGYWRKIYACAIDRFVYQLREGTWTFNDSIRFSQPGCETIGGTSGSPIIHATTGLVVGINNTGNEDGALCTLNNPCEVDEHGATTAEKGANYGQELHQIYTCLGAENELELDRAGCRLNKPR